MPEQFPLSTPEHPAPPVFEQNQQETPENTRVEHLEDATGSAGATQQQSETVVPEVEAVPVEVSAPPVEVPVAPAPVEPEPIAEPELLPVDPDEALAFDAKHATESDLEKEAAELARLRAG